MEEREDGGKEGETPHPNPGNGCAHRRGRTDVEKEERKKKQTGSGSPIQLPKSSYDPHGSNGEVILVLNTYQRIGGRGLEPFSIGMVKRFTISLP